MKLPRPCILQAFLLVSFLSIGVYSPLHSQSAAQSPANSSGQAVQRRGIYGCLYFNDADKAAQAAHYKAAAEEVGNADPPDPCLPMYLNTSTSLSHPPGAANPPNEEAMQLIRSAIAKGEAAWGADSVNLAPFLNGLAGQITNSSGDQSEAPELFQRVLAIYEKAYGPDDPRLVQQLEALAGVYDRGAFSAYSRCAVANPADQCTAVREQEFEKEEPLLLRAVEIEEKHPEENTPRGTLVLPLPEVLGSLGRLYQNEGKFSQAEDTYQQLATVQAKLYGPVNRDVVNTWIGLGIIYMGQGDYAQAEAHFQLALGAAKQLPPAEDATPSLASRILTELGRLSLLQKNTDQARSYLQQALDALCSACKPNDPKLLNGAWMGQIAGLYQEAGMYADSLSVHLRMIAIEEANPNNANAARMYPQELQGYAMLLRQMNRPDDAAKVDAQLRALKDKAASATISPAQ